MRSHRARCDFSRLLSLVDAATARFPHALALIPVGIAAVWILNFLLLLRIAALVSLGHHISADLALNGFHSRAGWIGFLLVAVGAMAAPRKIPFLAVQPLVPHQELTARPRKDMEAQASLEFLTPFMALMAAEHSGVGIYAARSVALRS